LIGYMSSTEEQKMRTLSARQQKILNFIRGFVENRAFPPTVRDIVRGCGISSTSVADYNLAILEREGFLKRHREVSRGIELLGETFVKGNRAAIPLIGTIAAGQPIPVPAVESWNAASSADTIEVPTQLLRGKENVFALKIKGLSMIDALINDGDVVLMQAASTVENGQMAAVWLKSEKRATLKKVFIFPDRIRLQPANSQMKPIYADPQDCEIQGIVIAVIRQLA
jgi:repressor LexA